MTFTDKQHEIFVKEISVQVKRFHEAEKKARIYKGATHSTRIMNFKKDEIIDVSQLNRILEINKQEHYAVLEPNVPMDDLVDATLKHGLLPPVVTEFPGITVGGGIQGGAGESSSFKWGGIHNCCLEYEMVLGNGEVIEGSPDKNKDLFWGTACSYGSLGIITLIKLKLIQAKSFVRLNYKRVRRVQEAIELIEKTEKDVDFLDGIMFGKNLGVVMFGYLTDSKQGKKKTFQKFYNEWFYLHAKKMVKKTDNWQETIPVRDYLFRYNRGLFWLAKYAFDLFRIPFNRLTRLFLDPFFRTRTVAWLVQATNLSQKYIVQDICVPIEKAAQFFDFVDKRFGIYPLWIMPARPAGRDEKLCPNYINTNLMIDIGIWGEPVKDGFSEFLQANRELEIFTKEIGGRKVLYAHAYYPEEEFWQIYDREWYEELRTKYHADTVFPDIYTKTNVSHQYQISAKSELIKFFKSPFKLPIIK